MMEDMQIKPKKKELCVGAGRLAQSVWFIHLNDGRQCGDRCPVIECYGNGIFSLRVL